MCLMLVMPYHHDCQTTTSPRNEQIDHAWVGSVLTLEMLSSSRVAIRQAISKSLVAYYQKCKCLSEIQLAVSV